MNRKDDLGDNIFEGGFLGLDNIGPFDRSAGCRRRVLEQSDGTAWMAKFCLNMLEIALRLANHDRSYEDIALKFFEHFASIATAMNELWDEQDGFFYDRLRAPDGSSVPLRARSMVGLLPLFAAVKVERVAVGAAPRLPRARRLVHREQARARRLHAPLREGGRPDLIALVDETACGACSRACSTKRSSSRPTGCDRSRATTGSIRSCSRSTAGRRASTTSPPSRGRGLFGGNSNWRGPVWFPLNFLAIESLRHLHGCLGDGFRVELPTGSGVKADLGAGGRRARAPAAPDLRARRGGPPPVYGDTELFQRDPAWRDHCSSTSTSTATPAKVSAPRTRRAGRRWSAR